jgi:hypothetical protein
MYLPKPLNNYIKEKEKNAPAVITEILSALRRSGHKNYTLFFDDNHKLVLLDMSKDIMPGVVMKGKEVKSFNNTSDFQSVTVNSYARYNILNCISEAADLERVKEIFRGKRTWVIYCRNNDDSFEASTFGMENYSHPNFRLHVNIGEKEIAYILNSLCKSIQRGNVFEDGDRIGNLYGNCDIKLTKSEDGFFDVSLISLIEKESQTETISENEDTTREIVLDSEPVFEQNDETNDEADTEAELEIKIDSEAVFEPENTVEQPEETRGETEN